MSMSSSAAFFSTSYRQGFRRCYGFLSPHSAISVDQVQELLPGNDDVTSLSRGDSEPVQG